MSEPSSTTSNAEIARQTTCPTGGGGMAAPAASQLLDDGVGIASSLLLALAAIALATNITVLSVWST